MNFRPRMGFPAFLIFAGLIGYFAYNGDTQVFNFDVKQIALFFLIGGIVWLLLEIAAASGGGRKGASERSVTRDSHGNVSETRRDVDGY